jgi:UDP-2-acetamido-3-amino-2,3-dideoxy-glucuronate N-acetyltransferase
MPDNALRYFKHPNALVESSDIGEGTRIWAFAHVMDGAHIGAGCNLCDHVFVESDVVIGNRVTVKNGVALWDGVVLEDFVFVGPFATFTNDKNPRAAVRKSRKEFLPTRVRMGASIGANATLLCGITVGRHAFVGAGAVVTSDVGDYAIVVGNPARAVGYMCECGRRLPTSLICNCGIVYEKCKRGIVRTATQAPLAESISPVHIINSGNCHKTDSA